MPSSFSSLAFIFYFKLNYQKIWLTSCVIGYRIAVEEEKRKYEVKKKIISVRTEGFKPDPEMLIREMDLSVAVKA